MHRRTFLQGAGAAGLALSAGSVAFAQSAGDARLVVVILRGGLDGLMAVPAYGDPAYATIRGPLALPRPGETGGVLDLDGTFGLHPALGDLHGLYRAGQLAVVHAAAPPYRERSHFDAQNVLENGTAVPFGARTGWLNRALQEQTGQPPAMAVGRSVPLLLQGPARAASADPLRRPRKEDGLLERVRALYRSDPALGPALEEGLAMQAMLQAGADPAARRRGKGGRSARAAVQAVGRVLASREGPRVAVFEMTGWDTHSNEAGVLGRQLGPLGEALAAFPDAMGPEVWGRTVVLAVTEFGRTVAANGSGGSDHGVGGAAFVLGGAVAGGRVVTDWPGLASSQLHEGRDLRPTTDLRSVFKGVLHDHVGVSERALDRVFPGSAGAAPVRGLVKG